jgi:hypothetical protein
MRQPDDLDPHQCNIFLSRYTRYIFVGNVHDPAGQAAYCRHCQAELISRDWYEITSWNLTADDECNKCVHHVPEYLGRRRAGGIEALADIAQCAGARSRAWQTI